MSDAVRAVVVAAHPTVRRVVEIACHDAGVIVVDASRMASIDPGNHKVTPLPGAFRGERDASLLERASARAGG